MGSLNAIPASEQRALVDRILAGTVLHRSPRLKAFLAYVCEETFAGRADGITELQIALHVFGRRIDYTPSADNVVRVQARVLRQKLAEHFASEGIDEAVVIQIPKGAYLPVFQSRAELAEAEPPEPRPPSSKWMLAAAALVVALAATSLWFWWQWSSLKAAVEAAAHRQEPTLSSGMVHPGRRTVVVQSDTGLAMAHFLTGKQFPLNVYAGPGYRDLLFADTRVKNPREFWGYLISRRFSDTLSASYYGHLMKQHANTAAEIDLRHPRVLQLRDLEDRNVILIGSPRANPWVQAFGDEISFRFEGTAGDRPESIRNLRPQAGESELFVAESVIGGSGHALGLLACFPNPRPGGRVLLLCGTDAAATEALTEIATSPAALKRLQETLKSPNLQQSGRFEAIIDVDVIASAVKGWRVLAYRTAR